MQSDPIRCCNCGTVFTMSEHLEVLRRGDHDTFYCPNGHPQSWVKKPTANEKRIKFLEEDKAKWIKTCCELREEVRELQKEPCPICGEMFTSVNGHMARMHKKEWAVEVERRTDQAIIDRVN